MESQEEVSVELRKLIALQTEYIVEQEADIEGMLQRLSVLMATHGGGTELTLVIELIVDGKLQWGPISYNLGMWDAEEDLPF